MTKPVPLTSGKAVRSQQVETLPEVLGCVQVLAVVKAFLAGAKRHCSSRFLENKKHLNSLFVNYKVIKKVQLLVVEN